MGILLRACCKFKKLLMEAIGNKQEGQDIHNMIFQTPYENAVNPFAFLTIASVCVGIFRSNSYLRSSQY